jgi:hypothetical protein
MCLTYSVMVRAFSDIAAYQLILDAQSLRVPPSHGCRVLCLCCRTSEILAE